MEVLLLEEVEVKGWCVLIKCFDDGLFGKFQCFKVFNSEGQELPVEHVAKEHFDIFIQGPKDGHFFGIRIPSLLQNLQKSVDLLMRYFMQLSAHFIDNPMNVDGILP